MDVRNDLQLIKSNLDLTFSQIARYLGVTVQTLYNWSNGKSASRENARNVAKLARRADVDTQTKIPSALASVARRLDVRFRRLEHALYTELVPLESRDDEFWEQLLQAVVTYPAIFVDVDFIE